MSTEGMNAADGASQGWRGRLRAAWQTLTGRANGAGSVDVAQALRESPSAPAIIDAVIGGIPAPTIVIDRDGKVLAFNAPAAEIAPALRPGEPALITLRMPEVVDAIRRVAATGESQRVEYYQRVPLERWFEVSVGPVSMPSGEARSARDMLVMTFHDLTPLRRVEEMRADFVANASHELRTPLAALSGFIETLQGPAKDDAIARERFLAIMRSQAMRMARLIDDLLSLSRIELNAHLRPNTPIELAPIVRQVVDGLQPLARERDVEIRINTPAEPLTVLGDRDELVRAIENLTENALKYGASGKGVDITLSRGAARDGADEARIVVRDYGPGIAREHLPRLTERFYRVDVAGSRAQGGTGLGLALVKHVLNRHGGRLAIESAPAAGASFTLHLPLRPAAAN
jgi:two-component system phosphate regulon sensor histidine kinase PhoR